MLLAGWEVRIVKNCDRDIYSFSLYGPPSQQITYISHQISPTESIKTVNNLFIFFQALKRKKKLMEKNSRKV